MTYNCESLSSTMNIGSDIHRDRSVLPDYSKFKARVVPEESRPRVPNPTHRRKGRNRSGSSSRKCSPNSSIALHDDQAALERLHRLQQEIHRIENDIFHPKDNALSSDDESIVSLDRDIRVAQSDRAPSRNYGDSEVSLGLWELENDAEEQQVAPKKKAQIPSVQRKPTLHQSMPLLGLQCPARKETKASMNNSSSLTNFLESHQDQRSRSTLQATRATTEDLRMDLNRFLINNRKRSHKTGTPAKFPFHNQTLSPSKVFPTITKPSMRRSKSLDGDEDDTDLQQSRPWMRRFRRQRKSYATVGSSTATTASISGDSSPSDSRRNWHNSTGQINFRRPSLKRSKSNETPVAPLPKQTLPPRSKTISYTTTHGKNANEQLGVSNHGFLTGSRIKRTFHNPVA